MGTPFAHEELPPVLQALAAWCYHHRRIVVVAWLAALVSFSMLASTLGTSWSESFELPGSDSQRAADLLESRFPAQAGDQGEIVFKADAGVGDPRVQAQMQELFDAVAETPGVESVDSPYAPGSGRQIGPEGDVAYARVQFSGSAFSVPTETIDAIVSLADDARRDAVRVELGGGMFMAQDGPGGGSEIVGLLAAVVILLLTFGSLLAMGLPIVTALFGIGIGVGIVQLLSNVVDIPEFATQLSLMIGIGVGIDYALFIVTRYRQGLHDELGPERSVILAMDTAGRAVLFAGITVVISILGLFFMGVEFVRGLSMGVSATVAVVLAASLTLLPAVLGFVGRNIDRLGLPFRSRASVGTRQSTWFRWSRVVQRRPWAAMVAGLVVLVVLAIPVLSIRLAFSDAGSGSESATTRRAYDLIAEGFGPGVNGPLILAVELPDGAGPDTLEPFAAELSTTRGVDQVAPPRLNPAGDTAVIQVTPETGPQAEETTELVGRLRDDVIPAATERSGVEVYVGGITAAGIDVSDLLAGRLPLFLGGVLALSFLLLMVVFRSILVPVKAVIVNLLGISAAYGVVVAVFQWGWLNGLIGLDTTVPIAPFVPMMMFAIVFGLSMDYEVFLLSRIREEYDRTGDNALAVADGLALTARVITAAALIMIMVFASFIFGDDPIVKIFGLGLAFAILVDATIVRLVLVPATMELLGDANWWFPRWLDRIVPRLHVEASPEVLAELEGEHDEREPVGAGRAGPRARAAGRERPPRRQLR